MTSFLENPDKPLATMVNRHPTEPATYHAADGGMYRLSYLTGIHLQVEGYPNKTVTISSASDRCLAPGALVAFDVVADGEKKILWLDTMEDCQFHHRPTIEALKSGEQVELECVVISENVLRIK